MAIINATDASFSTDVLEAQGMVLVDFWAPWCGPCKMISPVLDALDAEGTLGASIVKINIDEVEQVGATYGVQSVPTLMIFKDGEMVDSKVGVQSKAQLEAWVGQFA